MNHETDSKKTLKFVNNFSRIETHVRDERGLTKYNFPKKNISRLTLDNCNVIAIDSPILADSLKNLCSQEDEKESYLIIGANADMAQIGKMIATNNFSKILLHSGMGENKKEEFWKNTPENKWDRIYSLKEKGSLEFELD